MVQKIKKSNMLKKTLFLLLLFFIVAGVGLFLGSRYISGKLLMSNEAAAADLALLVENQFQITDAEVSYMKTLTFNEMEKDPINHRLMKSMDWGVLNSVIRNVYVVAPLSKEKVRYYTDEDTAAFFGFDINTPLNGVWLLNGKINTNGQFKATQREDIYRYTALDDYQKKGMKEKKAFGTYSSDAWGAFITGYAPMYTLEGNFVGLLGVDMAMDKWQKDARAMIFILLSVFGVTAAAMAGIFIFLQMSRNRANEIMHEEKEANEAKSVFLSRMSHDIRTPMNTIVNLTKIVQAELDDKEAALKDLKKIEISNQFLLSLINDILDMSQIEDRAMELHPEPYSYHEFLGYIESTFSPLAEKKKIRLTVEREEADVTVLIDKVRLNQLCFNLLSNAIKYTPEGGNVCFEVKKKEIEGNRLACDIYVTDDGIGMTKGFQKSMYEPFSQEGRMFKSVEGTGLGLSIVKEIVELLGGSIDVVSETNHGTKFHVCIVMPITEEKIFSFPEEAKADLGVLQEKCILIAEDHPLNQEIASRLLLRVGCEVFVVNNGEEAVREMKKHPEKYDAVLMDMRMPVMGGFAATKAIRSLDTKKAKTIPIIAMTANAFSEDRKESVEAGMNAHLAKPIDPKLFYETLAKLFEE